MDPNISKALNDKIYDRRKQGALELEAVVRDCVTRKDQTKIAAIVKELCHDFAYAWQHPQARNGGLIGLAAAAIALGTDDVAPYLETIVPPVLACFTDQDARVRYYACESMYNIAKVAKGEILVYFNDVFDALCKLAADSELSVKNGAELLDRLIKDIVSESAATYVSVFGTSTSDSYKGSAVEEEDGVPVDQSSHNYFELAFSTRKFIPILKERIHVLNPLTRNFLVAWIRLLDSIPELELVTYLQDFLRGFLKFLNEPSEDVSIYTQRALDAFLEEIKRIDKIKQSLAERARARAEERIRKEREDARIAESPRNTTTTDNASMAAGDTGYSEESGGEQSGTEEPSWIPGQDTFVDYPRILEILVDALEPSVESEDDTVRLTALRWIYNFFDICPEEILPFFPRLLSQVLPAMASPHEQVRQTAGRVNSSLMDYTSRLPDEDSPEMHRPAPLSRLTTSTFRTADERQATSLSNINASEGDANNGTGSKQPDPRYDAANLSTSQTAVSTAADSTREAADLDYRAAVGALTLHFLADHEATRVAALNWLILLHRKAPRKVLATNDGTFPALLKTLSDPDEAVVTKDLQLLAQISRNSDDSYFTSFIDNVLQLFGTDRKLLEQRGNLIIRQLCGSLNAERIYRTMADCLEREEDVEFATIMVQSLNNNLITAPQLAELRKRLRNIDNRDGQGLFVALFRSWCYNAVATFSLCLLAQAYEQAYQLLLIMGELEMTVQNLIEIDKLVQLLESPVFTYLRLQLLEPERYPYLYKCLYGVLMLLPQSAAFAALRNRLGSVSAIGYLHTPGRPVSTLSSQFSNLNTSSTSRNSDSTSRGVSGVSSGVGVGGASVNNSNTSVTSAVAAARHKSRDEGSTQPIVRWPELLDKFRTVQERARKARRGPLYIAENENEEDDEMGTGRDAARDRDAKLGDAVGRALAGAGNTQGAHGGGVPVGGVTAKGVQATLGHKSRSSLGNFVKQARGMGQKKK